MLKGVLSDMSESDYDSDFGMRVRLAAAEAIHEKNEINERERERGNLVFF